MGSEDDVVMVRDVVADEQRLALDGYRLIVTTDDVEASIGKIRLITDGESTDHGTVEFSKECPVRDETIVDAMLGYINAGGDPEALIALAAVVHALPRLQPTRFAAVDAFGHVDWVSYWKREDGHFFEVYHGIMAEEVTEEEIASAMELDPDEGYTD